MVRSIGRVSTREKGRKALIPGAFLACFFPSCPGNALPYGRPIDHVAKNATANTRCLIVGSVPTTLRDTDLLFFIKRGMSGMDMHCTKP